MVGGATFTKPVTTSATLVLPSRKGRKSCGFHNRTGNNAVSLISNASQSFGEGFRLLANSTFNFYVIQDGVDRLEDNFVFIVQAVLIR